MLEKMEADHSKVDVERVFKTIALIFSKREGVEITVKVTKKEGAIEK